MTEKGRHIGILINLLRTTCHTLRKERNCKNINLNYLKMMLKVNVTKNQPESSDSTELLELWERKSGQKTHLCAEKLCTHSDIEGAVVECVYTSEKYVIPLCTEHRNSTEAIELDRGMKGVLWSKF